MRTLILGFGATGKSVYQMIPDALIYDDENPIRIPWEEINLVIQSAGIPPHHPMSQVAQKRHIPIKTDIDLFWKIFSPQCVIGITGTNGKSTLTALITHILKTGGREAHMGGNIGIPVLTLPQQAPFYILELSSFQLALSQTHLYEIGILTNIAIDHIDWHGSFDAYIQAKQRLTAHLMIKDDEIPSHELASQNMRFAYAACLHLGLTHKEIMSGIESFKGLPHRQETIRTIGHVSFINDSKATNLHSTQYAFKCFQDKPLFWIAGGKPKQKGFGDLTLSSVYKAYYIGEAAQEFHHIFPGTICKDLHEAVQNAYQDAMALQKPCIILFSPACASFDQFQNFEHRGNVFRELVGNIL